MKKALIFISLLLVGLCHGPALHAETVSQKQTKKMASQFFNQLHGQKLAEPKLVWNGRTLVTERLFNPFYVYNHPKGGFVVIAADNKAMPVLAYSPEGKFNPDNISDGMKAMLREYALDIEYIRFDSRIPEEAIKAWNDYPEYLANLIDATTVTGKKSSEDPFPILENVYYSLESPDLYSDLYSPSQWRELVNQELAKSGSVPLGVITPEGFRAGEVIGSKGGFYAISFDDIPTPVYYRLMATEFLSDGQFARLGYTPELAEEIQEEKPFTFYDTFIAETRAAEEAASKALQEELTPSTPVLKVHGSGRYTVYIPAEVRLARIYNLGGAIIAEHRYRGTTAAHIDLLSQPSGFYFAEIIDNAGNRYGIKLIR